jgi:hypothetical protein
VTRRFSWNHCVREVQTRPLLCTGLASRNCEHERELGTLTDRCFGCAKAWRSRNLHARRNTGLYAASRSIIAPVAHLRVDRALVIEVAAAGGGELTRACANHANASADHQGRGGLEEYASGFYELTEPEYVQLFG